MHAQCPPLKPATDGSGTRNAITLQNHDETVSIRNGLALPNHNETVVVHESDSLAAINPQRDGDELPRRASEHRVHFASGR